MAVALALDISTSVIGWAIVQVDAPPLAYPLMRGHVDLRKIEGGLWSKLDHADAALASVVTSIRAAGHSIVRLFVEDPAETFRRGLSSAHTIALLIRFNALVSNGMRRLLGITPLYINATQARKTIGVPLLSKKKAGGVDQKEQTFSFLCQSVFLNESWPRNRNQKIQPWCYDEVDACVICWAGLLGLGNPV